MQTEAVFAPRIFLRVLRVVTDGEGVTDCKRLAVDYIPSGVLASFRLIREGNSIAGHVGKLKIWYSARDAGTALYQIARYDGRRRLRPWFFGHASPL